MASKTTQIINAFAPTDNDNTLALSLTSNSHDTDSCSPLSLPDELLHHIFFRLEDLRDLCNCARVCSYWFHTIHFGAHFDDLWRRFVLYHRGSSPFCIIYYSDEADPLSKTPPWRQKLRDRRTLEKYLAFVRGSSQFYGAMVCILHPNIL